MNAFVKHLFVLAAVAAFASCETEDGEGMDNSGLSINGYAQKGPFIKGSNITAYALNENLSATGESFPSNIQDDLGSFAIAAETTAPYLELRAEGYYFIENTGETSEAPIYLNAIVSSSQQKANINLLTTFASGRIKQLIRDGQPFPAAKEQAEKELLRALPFQSVDEGKDFEEMDITKDGLAHAMLLAASCLIQEGRNAGEVQELVSAISSDFEASGTLSEKLMKEMSDRKQQVSIPNVAKNLLAFYEAHEVEGFQIPPFYALLNEEYTSGFHLIDAEQLSMEGYDTDVQGGTKEYHAIACEDFTVESDVDWITAEADQLCTNLYLLQIHVDSNPGLTERTGHVFVKSRHGESLYTNTTRQRGNGQRIYIEQESLPSTTRSLQEGDKININGKDYALLFDPNLNLPYVDLPKSGYGYGISNRPDMVVAGKNGDVLCATFTYRPEVDDFIHDAGEETGITRASSATTPGYAALKNLQGYELPNPARARLETACALLTLQFRQEGGSLPVSFARLEVEFSPDGFLSGEVTTCMYPDQALYDPSYIVPETEYENKSGRLTIHNTDADGQVSFLVHPQTVSDIRCTAYDRNGNPVFQTAHPANIELRRGAQTHLIFSVPAP